MQPIWGHEPLSIVQTGRVNKKTFAIYRNSQVTQTHTTRRETSK